MNRLVDYLNEHHNPGGNAIEFTRVETIIAETDWSRKEILDMALEGREAQYLTVNMKTGYQVGDFDPEGLDLIGLWNKVYRKMGKIK